MWREAAGKIGDRAARGAAAVGSTLGAAYEGVTDGFDQPEDDAFGRYPSHYAEEIRKHFERFLDMPTRANYELGKPVKGYINKGILLGGGVAWQGWLVDVEVVTSSRLTGLSRARTYVVRMRDGDVVDVHDEKSIGVLRRQE